LQINVALNYGSKNELIKAIKLIDKNNLKINESNIQKNLFTNNIPDPEILIRTGNTKRLSNFLLWQIAYSEIFFVKKLWPDFNKKDFKKIIIKFKKLKEILDQYNEYRTKKEVFHFDLFDCIISCNVHLSLCDDYFINHYRDYHLGRVLCFNF